MCWNNKNSDNIQENKLRAIFKLAWHIYFSVFFSSARGLGRSQGFLGINRTHLCKYYMLPIMRRVAFL